MAILQQSLYGRLLGQDWRRLGPSMMSFHDGASFRGHGLFQVTHGRNLLARCLVKLAHLPPEGNNVAVCLTVKAQHDGEVWHRTFAGQPMITYQSATSDGRLDERIGPCHHYFRLEIIDGNLLYEPAGIALGVGPFPLRLPAWLGPRIRACESPTGQPNQTHVFVEVKSPLLGLLISYEGDVIREEEPQ